MTGYIGIEIYWGMLAGFISGAILALLLAAYMTPKWRIWAFINVTDVHELRRSGIRENCIPENGSWEEMLAIKTASDRELLLQIQERFNEVYVFKDDLTVPKEAQLFNSKFIKNYYIISSLFLLVLAIYLAIKFDNWSALFLAFLPVCGGIYWYYLLSNRTPQIILNSNGIQSVSSGFKSWEEITNEEIVVESNGTDSTNYLNYQFQGGNEHLCLENIDIETRKLFHLMEIYRNRFQNKK